MSFKSIVVACVCSIVLVGASCMNSVTPISGEHANVSESAAVNASSFWSPRGNATTPCCGMFLSNYDMNGAMVLGADGNLQVVQRTQMCRTTPSSLQHYWCSTPGEFKAGMVFGTSCLGEPAICVNPQSGNNIEGVVRNSSNQLWHFYQRYSDKMWFSGPVFGSNVACNPCIVCNLKAANYGNLEVFFKDGTGIHHWWRRATDKTWNDAGIVINGIAGNPSAAQDASYNIHLLVRATDGHLSHYIRSASDNQWRLNTKISGGWSANSAPSAVFNPSRNSINFVGIDGQYQRIFEYRNGIWNNLTNRYFSQIGIPPYGQTIDCPPALALGFGKNMSKMNYLYAIGYFGSCNSNFQVTFIQDMTEYGW
jgi:hypothetical protein